MTAARRSAQTVLAGDGRRLTLGKHLKSGGAGSIYLLPEAPTEVAKIYHPGFDRSASERKLAALIATRPKLPDIVEGGQRYVQMAWPSTTLHERNGQFCGFLMPAIDIAATSELELVLQEKQARAHGLPTGLGAKITLAANLAAVIAELHAQHHYVVDLKPVNLRFYRERLYMALLDCDGLSVHTPTDRFHATQFTPEYLAPEFQSGQVSNDGEERQDRFALAVVIFQLLNFGLHPFAGRPQGDRVPTDLPGRIAGRFYAYGQAAHKRIAPVPSSTHTLLPVELRQMFDLALGSRDGRVRPTSAQWASVLKDYARRSAGKLVVCKRNPEHQHFAGLACAACVRQGHIEKSAKRRPQPVAKPQPSPPYVVSPQFLVSQLPPVAPPASVNVLGTSRGLSVLLLIIVIFVIVMVFASKSELPPSSSVSGVAALKQDETVVTTVSPGDVAGEPWGDDEWERELRRAGELALKGKGLPFREQMRRLELKAPVELNLTGADRDRQLELRYNYFQLSKERAKEATKQLDQVRQELYELNPYLQSVASEQAFHSAIKLVRLRAQARGQSAQALETQAYQEALARVERAFAHSLRSAYILDTPLRDPWFGLAILYFEREQYEAVTGALAICHSLPMVSNSFDLSRLDFMRKTWLQRHDYKQARWEILDARAKITNAKLNGSEVAPGIAKLAARPWPAEPLAEKAKKPAATGRSQR